MALGARAPLSFSFVSPKLPIVPLHCPVKPSSSSSSKCFLHPHRSKLRTQRRRSNPLPHPRFLRQSGQRDYEEEIWAWRANLSGALLAGALDDEGGGGGWDAPNGHAAVEGAQLQERQEEEGAHEAGGWSLPVSSLRTLAEEHHQEEVEEDEDGCGGSSWWKGSFFLRSQEGVSSTMEMEEILACIRSLPAEGPGLAEFLAGYNRKSLNEEECMELMRRMGEEGLALECFHFFRWMRALEDQLVMVSPQAWLLALAVLGRARMADEVLDILRSLPLAREYRLAVLYNLAIAGVANCGRYDDAREIFELMEKNNVQPDHMTSSIMLKVMNKCKASAKDAWEFFHRMNRKGVMWSLDVCASLIKIFCDEGLKKEALIIQSEMEKRGIALNTSIYNTIMKAYCKCSQIEEAEGLFVELKGKGLKPTTVTYNVLMDAYSKRLQPEVVESLLLEMKDLGLQPNARSYNCLIRAYGWQKKMSDKAEDAFLRMKKDAIKPTCSEYTSLICAYGVNGQHEKAYSTYTDMKTEGVKPSLETYTALLNIFRRAGDVDKLMETWKSMIDEKVGGTRVIFHMILDGLAKHGMYIEARDVIYEFGKIGLAPTAMTYNILMNAYAKGGQHYKLPQLLKEMSALELKSDSVTYSTMIYAYARVRDFSRAFYYHKQMVRSRLVPDAKSYRKLLNTLDVKDAKKNIKDKGSMVAIVKSKAGLKHRKEKKDEFWKNSKKRSMVTRFNGHPKRYL